MRGRVQFQVYISRLQLIVFTSCIDSIGFCIGFAHPKRSAIVWRRYLVYSTVRNRSQCYSTYLCYIVGKGYPDYDSRIVSARLGGLKKGGIQYWRLCEKVTISKRPSRSRKRDTTHCLHSIGWHLAWSLVLRVTSRRSYFYKKLLKIYHEMGDASAMPLPNQGDKNCTTSKH